MSIEQIASLLKQIIVFELKFKQDILAKATNLGEQKLSELQTILLEVKEWQEQTLHKILVQDPDFYDKILDAKRKTEREIINLYKQKLETEDHKKMEIILDKIKSL